jgi:hypothetical protein
MTMLRDRRLAPHPTSTPITAKVIHGQSQTMRISWLKLGARLELLTKPDLGKLVTLIRRAI